ncbi:uncharacterized protein UTRI_10041 [Ustilago trichophora]|uniref:Uncharacterized protein n=1 Tax=Ustilago trichophora TaxID=86804 RepID=A0A5C3DQN0_9BASI|nr:uncharacterized protein UTRI_10041 [Ustilago trichophora]
MTVDSRSTSPSLPDIVSPSSTRSTTTSRSSIFTSNTTSGGSTNTNADSDTSSASEDRRTVEALLPACTSPITPTPSRRRRDTDALEDSPGCARRADMLDCVDGGRVSRVADRMAAAFASTGPVRGFSVLPQPRSSISNAGAGTRAESQGVSAGIGAVRNSATSHGVFGAVRPSTPSVAGATASDGLAAGSNGGARARSVVAKTEDTAPTATVDEICIVGVVKAEASAPSLAASASSTSASDAMGPPTQPTVTNSEENRTAFSASARLAVPVFGRTSTPAPLPAIQPSTTTPTNRARQPSSSFSSSTSTHRDTPAPAPIPRSLSAIRRARSLTPYTRSSTHSRGLVGITRAAAARRGVTTRRNAVEEEEQEVVMIDSFPNDGRRDEEEAVEREDRGVSVVIPTSEMPGGREDSIGLRTTSDARTRSSANDVALGRPSNNNTAVSSSDSANDTSSASSTNRNKRIASSTITTTTTRPSRINNTPLNPNRTSNTSNSTSSDSDDTSEVVFTNLQTRSQIQRAAQAANAQLREERAARRNAGPLGGRLLAIEAGRAASAAAGGGSGTQVHR